MLISLAAISILAGESLSGIALAWVGVPSIILFLLYLGGVRWIFPYERSHQPQPVTTTPSKYGEIDRKTTYFRFILAALAIIGAGIWLAFIGDEIAATYSLSASFVGSLFLAITTSMPELAVTIAAVRLGAIDMALADILGANMLNMANIFTTDLFYTSGPVLSVVSSEHLITAVMAIAMTILVIIGLRFRQERKTFRFISWYGVVLILLYLIGSYLLFSAGMPG